MPVTARQFDPNGPCGGAFGCGHPISEHNARHGCTRYPCECDYVIEDFRRPFQRVAIDAGRAPGSEGA